MKTNSWLVLGALVLILAGIAFFATPAKPCKEGCNVILIMVDTLSAKHLATYGYDRDTMPKTTAFFEDTGVIFENANSLAPWTLPSFTGMYFSDLPSHVTYADLEGGSRPSLQTELRANNVELRAVIPGLNGVIFDGITRRYQRDELYSVNEDYGTVDLAIKQIEELATSNNPFFLLVHTFEAHDPYQPRSPFNAFYEETDAYPVVTRDMTLDENKRKTPDPERVETYKLRYDQQIAQTDNSVAAILHSIPEDMLEHTVVILSADHGEAFNEHGILNHASTLFQEEIHIPLMMRAPGIVSRRIAEPVSLLDMTPTILSLMDILPSPSFKGSDLTPLLRGGSLGTRIIPSLNGRPYYFANMVKLHESVESAGALGVDRPVIDVTSVGVRIGNQHVFIHTALPEFLNGVHWYDLAIDPEEQHNLATDTALPEDFQRALDVLSKELPATP